ncbi:hypothetical protein Tco_0889805 [Tanacetum coccineum]
MIMIIELAKKLSLETHQRKGKGKVIDADLGTKLILSLDQLSASRKPHAPKDDKDQGEVDSSTVTSGVSIPVSDPVKAHEALAGPDPEPMKEDQTGSDSGKLHVSLAGPNPEHMDDEFLATAYPKVHENLKLITDERVINDKPESHSGSMSSMKNLDDTFNFGINFLHDKNNRRSHRLSRHHWSLLHQSTESYNNHTSLPEITPSSPFSYECRLVQEMSKVKMNDHSADVLALIEPSSMAVDNILGTKLDDALLKVLERHTADLIEKYSVLPGPENTANYRLTMALMEALITDEDAMDKEVADRLRPQEKSDSE